MRNRITLLAVLLLTSFGRSEEIDNPSYKTWAAYKAGTTIIMKTVTDTAGQKTESLMTWKLVEVTPDKVVLEMSMKTKAAGQEFDIPASKSEQPRKLKIEGSKPPLAGTKPKDALKEGEETLKVDGKEYKCKWYETKTTLPGVGDMTAKTWICQDLPTSTVKMESSLSGPAASKTTMELVEVKTP